MNQEEPVVNVLFEGGYTLVIEGPDGGEQTFYRNTNRTLYLEVRQLRVSDNQCPVCGDAWLVELGNGTRGPPPQTSLCVRGRATLGGGSVSVMGAPGNTAHILGIDFIAFDEDVYKRQQEEARKCGTKESYTHAALGFVHHQQSAAGSDDWFVECELAPDTLRAISSAVSSGRLHGLTVGLALPDVYSDDWERAPGQTSWFLRPNDRDNRLDRPERAHGRVTRLCFDVVSPARHRLCEERDELKDFEVTEAGALSE